MTDSVLTPKPSNPSRRRVLQAGASVALMGAPAILRAQARPKIRVGFWPIASGLPFFVAIEKGYFKEAGLDVEGIKFAGAQQVMEAMLSGRSDGSANGTGSANLAIGEIAQPGLFKIFCTNPEQREVRARRVHRAQGQHLQDDRRLQGQAARVGPRHPERHARARRCSSAPAPRARR